MKLHIELKGTQGKDVHKSDNDTVTAVIYGAGRKALATLQVRDTVQGLRVTYASENTTMLDLIA